MSSPSEAPSPSVSAVLSSALTAAVSAAMAVATAVDAKADLAKLLDEWEEAQRCATEQLVSVLTKSESFHMFFCLSECWSTTRPRLSSLFYLLFVCFQNI